MKATARFLITILLLLMSALIYAQPYIKPATKPEPKSNFPHGRAGIAVGWQYPYRTMLTDISCRMVLLKAKVLMDARVRAYGSRSMLNGRDYDFLAYIHKVKRWTNSRTFFYGAGLEMNLRRLGYDRGTTDVQLLLVTGSQFHTEKFYFNFPLWVNVSQSDFAVTILPEPSYKLSKDVQLFLHYELQYRQPYAYSYAAWNQALLFGSYFYF